MGGWGRPAGDAELTEPNWGYWRHAVLGATVMDLLMFSRQRFVWWPFHPIGFPVSVAISSMFLAILLAWAPKE